ncbi:pyridine nucleotide-disulfide oxidoreductase family protein [Desulfuromonas soudanensis]|uniref:Pyridine nucleotide-disulfide oxidoreductase family protein n=1 Tax=Desulfuromonas soudanensis TaxID=1603606 RepID=A0A0M4D891_9BACT|nr:FAD-dependent oxidoreductase [Desulfuromonas soudanensis]ALC17522.1 pyridine nucleotide-disulfide oxidoreductase family protein [Desulfuromonas soudanensis]
MGKHLVLAGGGHAHMTVLARLDQFVGRGHRVTLISPSPYQYYSGMGPGLLAGTYRPQEVRFHIRKMIEAPGGSFLEDRVSGIDAAGKRLHLASGGDLSYDAVSFNTGSGVPLGSLDGGSPNVLPVKPIENLLRVRETLLSWKEKRPPRLLVVGGGPAGVELAGNLWRLLRELDREGNISLVGGSRILKAFPDRVRTLARRSLENRGIVLHQGVRTKSLAGKVALLSDGASIPFDLALVAVGVSPAPLFRDSGLATGEDGGLTVNAFLQSPDYPEIFGGGDCIHFAPSPLDKVGVHAVRQNPVLLHNLLAALDGGPLRPYLPPSAYLLILNLGDGRGILSRRGWTVDGRLAFLAKDYIDRRFMKKFQISGELKEEA